MQPVKLFKGPAELGENALLESNKKKKKFISIKRQILWAFKYIYFAVTYFVVASVNFLFTL